MALYARYVIVRPTSDATPDVIRSFVNNWLSGLENADLDNQFFCLSLDLKYKNLSFGIGPRTRRENQAGDDLAYFPSLDWSVPPLTEARVIELIDERLKAHGASPSQITWGDLPPEVQEDIKNQAVEDVLDQMPPTQDMVDQVVARERAKINVQPSDIAGDAIALLISELRGQLDLRQAQSDLVAEGMKVLLRQMDGIEDSAQVGAFRKVLAGLATKNAELLSALETDKRVEVRIL